MLPQWSRPASLFMRGVRPNSPITTTSVDSYRPLFDQVLDQGAEGAVEGRDQLLAPSSVLSWGAVPWWSQGTQFTVTNGVPASTSRRAIRRVWPKVCRP